MVARTTHAFQAPFVQPERWSLFGGMIQAVKDWHRRQVARAELEALSDRELQDIGITRGDFHAIIEGTYQR
jgi:uncharacterized protein YjiS (DUF1127 family)